MAERDVFEATHDLISSDSLPNPDRAAFAAEQRALLAKPENRALHDQSTLRLGQVTVSGDRAEATLIVEMADAQSVLSKSPAANQLALELKQLVRAIRHALSPHFSGKSENRSHGIDVALDR